MVCILVRASFSFTIVSYLNGGILTIASGERQKFWKSATRDDELVIAFSFGECEAASPPVTSSCDMDSDLHSEGQDRWREAWVSVRAVN